MAMYRMRRGSDGSEPRPGLSVRNSAYVAHMDAPALELADPTEVAVAHEYLAMKARIAEGRDRAERLRKLAEHVEALVAQDERILAELEGALGMAAQLQIEQLSTELGGKRLLEVAITILKRQMAPGQVVHYKEWFALLQSSGFQVKGKDPLASFLAQVSRSPDVEAVGQRTGQYRLRAA